MLDRPLDQYAAMLPLEACGELRTSPQGLSDAEARERLAQVGPNTISDLEQTSILRRLAAPFANWITAILLVAGLLAFVSGTPVIGWAIIIVALLNGLFTAWQEYLAEREIAALRKLLPPTTYVRRSGQVRQVPTAEIVPGDILPLKPGTVVVADSYLVASEGMRVKQTSLTGNSAPVTKVAGPMPDPTLALTERPNLVLAGTVVFEGQGSAMAVGTGMRTLLGQIAESTAALRPGQSPLGRALSSLAATITRLAITAGVATFVLSYFVQAVEIRAAIIFAIGMIVAFVPEGLLPTVSLALALARRRLDRDGVIVKRLAGVESLGSATVLCLDRTDTLGSGALVAQELWAGGSRFHVTGEGYVPQGSFLRDGTPVDPAAEPDLTALLRAAALSASARLLPPDEEHSGWHLLGDPTEGALLVAAAKAGAPAEYAESATRLQTFPYEPRRQMAGVVVAPPEADRRPLAVVRGSANVVLQHTTAIRRAGESRPLDDATRRELQAQIDAYARTGARVVALAERRLDQEMEGVGFRPRDVEHDLTLLGLVALQEPPQPQVAQLVQGCRRAGIRVIVVTGSYGLTAETAARRAGIITAQRVRIITGAELDQLSRDDLLQALAPGEEVLFAQMDTEQKRRVVQTLQERGEVVAFLGDSINDAPALKQADIGVTVSASGTTVALAAADMVLNADHPAGLLLAVGEGRTIFGNIRKVATYIFTHNVAETVAIVLSALAGLPLPLTVLQVLAIDLGTEVLPSVALSTEAPEPGILDQPPRARSTPLLDREALVRVFGWLGPLEGALALIAYFMAFWAAGWRPGAPPIADALVYAQATTLTYAAIVLAQVGNAFASRTRDASLFQVGLFSNRALLLGVLASLALMLALLYTPPLARIFGFVPPTPAQWALLASFPFVMLFAEEGRKWLARRRARS
ncbi:MAG: cation-transporting P-type ATPase [Chloroflexota bacterium]